MSANALESIPPSSQSEESLSTLQELYLTGNNLNENCGALLVGHQNLRILHIAYNQLLSFPARCVSQLLRCFKHQVIIYLGMSLLLWGCFQFNPILTDDSLFYVAFFSNVLCSVLLFRSFFFSIVLFVCLFSKLSKLELLEELNLSGNKLKTIPSTVSNCKRLHTLIAHSNHITVFPEILNLPEIKVRPVIVFFVSRDHF